MQMIDLSGEVFGRLTALRRNGRRGKRVLWLCRCECGIEKDVASCDLRSGDTVSCGCHRRDALIAASTTHGKTDSTEAHIWNGMKQRCLNPSARAYSRYGGRGITVCARWLQSLENFLADMGPRPPGCSLDRIDNDGNYDPGNCRWATRVQQAQNKRDNVMVNWRGEMLCLKEAARRAGLPYPAVHQRVAKLGWTPERAVTTALQVQRRCAG